MSGNGGKKSKKAAKSGDTDMEHGGEEGGAAPELTKDEAKIARFLRLSCPKKQGNLVGMKVDFFVANKLVDCLMESRWGPGLPSDATASETAAATTTPNAAIAALKTSKSSASLAAKSQQAGGKPAPYFASRQDCVAFMQRMLHKQLFYRVVKIYKETTAAAAAAASSSTDAEDGEATAVEASEQTNESPSSTNVRKRKTAAKGADQSPQASPQEQQQTPSSSSSNKQQQQQSAAAAAAAAAESIKNSKRKFKLEMHQIQTFVDAAEPYVWIYDATSTTTYLIGAALILGAIGICLFPLWPSQLRDAVYYLSMTGLSFIGAILGLAVFKYIFYACVWIVTLGRVHLWLFPNLTEDVGFFESFVPVYQFGNNGSSNKTSSSSSSSSTSGDKKKTDEVTKDTKQQAQATPSSNTTTLAKEASTPSSASRKSPSSADLLKESQYELSKSTVEINSNSIDSPCIISKTTSGAATPTSRKTSATSNNNNNNDDDDFELVEQVDQ